MVVGGKNSAALETYMKNASEVDRAYWPAERAMDTVGAV